jgi:hypothetical protein
MKGHSHATILSSRLAKYEYWSIQKGIRNPRADDEDPNEYFTVEIRKKARPEDTHRTKYTATSSMLETAIARCIGKVAEGKPVKKRSEQTEKKPKLRLVGQMSEARDDN